MRKTINPFCAGNKVFVKCQSQEGVQPQPLAYALGRTQSAAPGSRCPPLPQVHSTARCIRRHQPIAKKCKSRFYIQ